MKLASNVDEKPIKIKTCSNGSLDTNVSLDKKKTASAELSIIFKIMFFIVFHYLIICYQ